MNVFSERHTRNDLRWIIDSPSLLDGNAFYRQTGIEVFEFPKKLNQESDEVVLPSVQDDFPRTHRVGDYFEQLAIWALAQSNEVEVLASHQQIFESNRTVGEIDCIYQDEGARITHLEVAVKFFLMEGQPSKGNQYDLAQFVGPNPRDNFQSKIDHMVRRQLQLGAKTEYPIDRKQVLLRGYLFYPKTDSIVENSLPALVNHDHLRGTWCRADTIFSHLEWIGAEQYWIVPKPHWLAPLDPSDRESHDSAGLGKLIQEELEGRATAIYFQSAGRDGMVGHHFVVDNQWPHLV
ncbi:MAG: DUF1853 family protein [Aureliella sp.]